MSYFRHWISTLHHTGPQDWLALTDLCWPGWRIMLVCLIASYKFAVLVFLTSGTRTKQAGSPAGREYRALFSLQSRGRWFLCRIWSKLDSHVDLVKELHKYFTFTDNLFMNINAETFPTAQLLYPILWILLSLSRTRYHDYELYIIHSGWRIDPCLLKYSQ